MGPEPTTVISIICLSGDTIKFRSHRVSHGLCSVSRFQVPLVILFGSAVVFVMTGLLDLAPKLCPQHVRFLKLVEDLFGFVDDVPVVDAAELEPVRAVVAGVGGDEVEGAGRILPEPADIAGWPLPGCQFYSHQQYETLGQDYPSLAAFYYGGRVRGGILGIILIQAPLLCQHSKVNNRQMSFFSRMSAVWSRAMENPQTKNFITSPITKIIGINTALFLAWRIKGVSQKFLVKHFSFDRFNIREHRYYTALTYAFSHFGFFHYLFEMIMIASFGRAIKLQYGNKMVWWLYLLGAVAGGLTMQFGMPYTPMVIPQVGADASIASMLTFYGLCNLNQSILFFVFPMRMWVLLSIMGVYCLFEPSKKNLGGMLAGLIVYQLFRVRII